MMKKSLYAIASILMIAMSSILEPIFDAVVKLSATFEPTPASALDEINVTGHAIKRNTASPGKVTLELRTRNDAARHVAMLKSIGGAALAA